MNGRYCMQEKTAFVFHTELEIRLLQKKGQVTTKKDTEDLRLAICWELSRLHSLSDTCTRLSVAHHNR